MCLRNRVRSILVTLGLCLYSSVSLAGDKLVIISPHRKSIQDEFVPTFKDYYKKTFGQDIDVEWVDQGGTSDDIKFVRSKYAGNKASSGLDIFWGGGGSTFIELEAAKVLSPYALPKDLQAALPATAAGVPMRSSQNFWHSTAISSFGIFYNRKVLAMEKIAEPKTWEDLAEPKYFGQISATDPRHSGSANSMMNIILQGYGWDKGWAILTRFAANTKQFTQSSSDPIKAVVSGDTATAMVIDFYAVAKIGDLGKANLGFVLPPQQTILDPDPVAILKGAANRVQAERFINYVLSADAQRLLLLPKGSKGGPKFATIGRMAANPQAYDNLSEEPVIDFNPFKQKGSLELDLTKAAIVKRVLNDLLGATQIDVHKELVSAWQAVIKQGLPAASVESLVKPPFSEKEVLDFAKQWDNQTFRNERLNQWRNEAKARYQKLAAK